MAKEQLLKAIQQQADEEVARLRAEAQERYASLRKEYAVRLRLARAEIRTRQSQVSQQQLNAACYRHEQALQQKTCEHRWALEERCRPLAASTLETYWQSQRAKLLPHLLDNLPKLNWSQIRIAPADLPIAKNHAPNLKLVADKNLSGGLVAECSERNMTYDQSLATCLERLWPTLLPKILEKISDESRHSYN